MIELRANGIVLKQFANVNITLRIDTIASAFTLSGYLDLSDKRSRSLFVPYTYPGCQVWYVDEENNISQKLITGTILNPALSVQKKVQLSNLSGYSKTGVLEDTNIPITLYPLQTDGLGLDQVAKTICDYFGITLFIFDNAKEDAEKVLTQVKATPSQKIKEYLSNIASSRNITISHDNRGRLLLYKILAEIPPSVSINEDDQTLKISTSPNGQGVHSDITVIRQSSTTDENAGEATVISPFMSSRIKRPLVQTLNFGENTDAGKMAEAITCREAKNFPITIEKEGWTIQNKLIRAGFYIEVTAPSIFLRRTKLIVQSINFKSNPKDGKTMTIIAVLPCVYTGVLPSKNPFNEFNTNS